MGLLATSPGPARTGLGWPWHTTRETLGAMLVLVLELEEGPVITWPRPWASESGSEESRVLESPSLGSASPRPLTRGKSVLCELCAIHVLPKLNSFSQQP